MYASFKDGMACRNKGVDASWSTALDRCASESCMQSVEQDETAAALFKAVKAMADALKNCRANSENGGN
eukprot:6176894-Pleurochrysis_carterae.AAC.2